MGLGVRLEVHVRCAYNSESDLGQRLLPHTPNWMWVRNYCWTPQTGSWSGTIAGHPKLDVGRELLLDTPNWIWVRNYCWIPQTGSGSGTIAGHPKLDLGREVLRYNPCYFSASVSVLRAWLVTLCFDSLCR